jgi:anti-sigma B factor antagonist
MADPFTATSKEPRARARRRPRAVPVDSRLVLRTEELSPGVVVVTADGEIDLANRAELAGALAGVIARHGLKLLVCDLTRVTFLACTGVSTLAEVRSELDGRGAALRLVTTDPVVLRVLDITGQRELLGVRPHLTSALTGFVPARATPPKLAHLRLAVQAAVEQTTDLARLCDRLAEQVSAVEADRLVDRRGEDWHPDETLTEVAEDLRVLRNHLTTGALLAAPTVEDLRHLHDESST